MSLSQIPRQIYPNLCAAFECRPFGLEQQNLTMSTQLYPGFENSVSNNVALTSQRLSQVPTSSRPSKLDTRSQINEEVKRLCNLGKLETAWQILNRINCEDKVTLSDVYVCLLRACTNMRVLTEGKRVHAHLIKSAFQPDIFLTNTLLNMYANCASIVETEAILYRMVSKNVYTWTIMLAGYTRLGHDKEALVLFQDMQDEGVSLDKVTFICVLGVCATLGALDQGRLVHAHIIKSGLLSGVFIENTLISMYTRCASIEEAEQVFCHMSLQDNVSWNALILGYVHHGNDRQVLSIFQQIEQKGMIPNKVAFIGILNACVNLSSLYQGEHVHVQIKEAGYGSDLFVCNKLIDMYSKCGNIENARGVFNNMSIRNIVSWTSIITGYAQLSMGEEALNLFCAMQDEDIDPNEITFVSVLSACGTLGVLEQAKWVHSHVIESGCMSNQFVGNTLIDMYAKCGSLEDAEYSFDRLPLRNIVSWNALITGYAIHQNGVEVVKIFQQMQQERMSPNLVTFSNIINACAASGNLGQGKYVHSLIEWTQIETNVYVGTALVDMYAKCGRVQDAKQVFQSMPARNIISWTTMVACLCEKNAKEAIILFKQMEKEGLEPDTVTFVYVLNACASLAAIGKGKWLHAQNINTRCVFVGNALIDMHAKCGKIQHACQVFDRMHIHDSVSWNAIIAGYAAQGYGRKAVHLFRSMQLASIKPDLLTFISLLSACSHSGLMSEGHHYYVSMTMEHVVSPTGDHFASVVALLGRNGSLDEAEDFVTSMPLEPCVVVLTAFLSVCKIHMELDMAKNALERVLRLEDQNSSAYVLLSNIYGAAGWEDDNLVTKI